MYFWFIASCLILFASSCPTTHAFTDSSCVFYMTYTDNTCSDFNFNYCTYTNCPDELDIPCSTITNKDWKQCTQQCCDYSSNYHRNVNSLGQCQSYIDSHNSSIWDPLFFIFRLIFTLLGNMLLCCCCCCCCCFWCLRKFGKNMEELQRELRNRQREAGFQDVPEQNGDIENAMRGNTISDQIWIKTAAFKEQTKQECSICQEQDPSVEFQCGHIFHRSCIVDSIQQKQQCPDCQSVNLSNIRVFCQDCYEWYYEASLLDLTFSLSVEKQLCGNCQRHNVNFY